MALSALLHARNAHQKKERTILSPLSVSLLSASHETVCPPQSVEWPVIPAVGA